MSTIKSSFVRELQSSDKPHAPYDVSQKIRVKFNWVCVVQWDDLLNTDRLRGYMIRTPVESFHTADCPAEFSCVVAKKQGRGWQNVIWIKEMLQAIDDKNALTGDKSKLGQILDNRTTLSPNGDDTPAHMVADKNGFLLALGVAVPSGLRIKLRQSGSSISDLNESELKELENIPEEYIPLVLDYGFEKKFEQALREIETPNHP